MTRQHIFRPLFSWLLAGSVLLSGLLLPAELRAQALPAAPGLMLTGQGDSLRVTWQADVQAAAEATGLPMQVYGGYLLPLQTQLIELPAGADSAAAAVPVVRMLDLQSAPYQSLLTLAPEETPPALDWEPDPSMRSVVEPRLPEAPLFILQEGMQRGRRLAVLAFSPIHRDPASGEVRYATRLDAAITGAAPARDIFADATAHPDNQELFAPVEALATAPGPTNPLAARAGVLKLLVSQPGIQEVTKDQLVAAGLATADKLELSRIRAYLNGVEVPLHLPTSGPPRIRFYAPTVGDRWNTESFYWLVQDSQPGLRMNVRSVSVVDVDLPTRDTGLEPGRIVDKKLYQSSIAGPDRENWFSFVTDTRPNSGAPIESASITLNVPRELPAASASDLQAQVRLHGTVSDSRPVASFVDAIQPHRLEVKLGATTLTDDESTWVIDFLRGSKQDFTRTFHFSQGASQLSITLLAATQRHRVFYTAIETLLPARLDFKQKGAIFEGVTGIWRYELRNSPPASSQQAADPVDVCPIVCAAPNPPGLYDITNPAAPQVLSGIGEDGPQLVFQDGPQARRYLVAGPGTVFTPAIVKATPASFPANGAAHTVYIAPQEFHATLAPLVQLRTSQKYQVRVVDLQSIYDAWSFGKVDPAAIRSFLRFAVGRWNPAPVAAVLVGDGHYDPQDYYGHGNPNVIPPYMADVDPWIGETACESCYGQLDGADPLDETAFLLDVWIGRFPVNSKDELARVVAKIVAYESDTSDYSAWRGTALHIVDDYVRPDGSLDGAGNFWAAVEKLTEPMQVGANGETRGLQPPGLRFLWHYFLADTALDNLKKSTYFQGLRPERQQALIEWVEKIRPWSTSDLRATQQRTVAYMNSGVGLVSYTGHSNHYYYATLYQLPDGFFNLNDVGQLTNRQSPFIMLSMTCYTSQFSKPDPRPTTIDERLFLHDNGGAIAVWGPAGLSVATGHDKLQEGFYHKLWSAPMHQAKLGALVQAGYNVVSASAAHLDVNKTFLLLGDPLTSARIGETEAVWLPTVSR